MGGLQTLRDLHGNFEHLKLRHFSLEGHQIIETALVNQLHSQIKLPVIFTE